MPSAKAREYGRRYREANRETINQRERDRYQQNIEVQRERKRASSAASKARMLESPERKAKYRAYQSEYLRLHPEKARLFAANKNHKRRHGKLFATPRFANRFFMEEAHALARRRSQVLGFDWHVDHVVPLKSSLVCGLHYEKNFAVIPGALNASKRNRFWPDMPTEESK